MGATKQAGDKVATVIDQLERDWRAKTTSPAVVAAFERWGSEDEILGQFATLAALVSYVECRARPAAEREAVLAALACRAGDDATAAQLLLVLLLPGCKAMVASFGWLGDSPGELAADVVGDVWARIRALPATPRPQWVALPVLGAAREQLRRRAHQAARETPSELPENASASELLALEAEPSVVEELAEVLKQASDQGVLSVDQVSLIWSYRVLRVPPAEASRRCGTSPGALERRRLRAELRLRQTYGVAAVA